MNKLVVIIVLFLGVVGCKSDCLDEVLKTSKTPELDKVYHAVVEYERKLYGASLSIVDRTMGTAPSSITGIDIKPISDEFPQVIYWKKEIFPEAEYISGDSLIKYYREPEKYWKLREECSSGWIDLSVPYFDKDKKRAVIEVGFTGRGIGGSNVYLLELQGESYKIIDTKLVSI